jgi:DNA-binding transcriptional MerR regulator
MLTETFTIGELARIAGAKVETIRYYERIGLLPSPARTRGNYRAYGRSHLERLSFIRRGRELGFSLDVVWDLLRLSDDRKRSCAEIDELARVHLADVENKLADLVGLSRVLHQLIDQCQHGTVADCRIIQVLAPSVYVRILLASEARQSVAWLVQECSAE